MPPTSRADRLHGVEVWTRGGTGSSFPPHKHEHDVPGEAQLEETYYYRLRDPGNGWAIQRVYSPERDFELDETIRDGDICLIPWGYHTTVAAHGHDLYYLNVLAGPAPERTLQAREDPTLADLRPRSENIDQAPPVPFVPRHPRRAPAPTGSQAAPRPRPSRTRCPVAPCAWAHPHPQPLSPRPG